MIIRRFIQGLTLALLVCVTTILYSVSIAQELPVFRIGVLDAERGAIARGAGLAIREINQSGGVTGADGTRFRLELITEFPADDESLADAIDRIGEADVIAVLGPQTTNDVLTFLPQLQRLGVPVLTPAIGDTLIATDTSGLLFRIRAAERFQGRALASLLVNDLNILQITTVQLDRDSTGARVGFSVSLTDINPNASETNYLLDDTLPELIAEVLAEQPPIVAAFGAPEIAVEFYNGLRDGGWIGFFAYPDAGDPAFRDAIPLENTLGIIGTTTWPVSAVDIDSATFITRYIQAFSRAPGEIEAAAYDGIQLIARAIGEPGSLRENLTNIRDVQGVQGILNPTGAPAREMSESVAVVQLNALGGPETVARYASNQRRPPDEAAPIGGTPQPTPSPTLDGVFITIQSARQNIRNGPGLNYDVIGQLQQGDQRRVIGATVDFAWVVIEYRGENGWLSTSLLDLTGNRETVPIVQPPPTPTPPPATDTPIPPQFPDLIITGVNPPSITLGLVTNLNVTIRNQGTRDAGPFAIAATFPPDEYFSAVNLPGLPAGQEQTVLLPVLLNLATGNFTVTIVADLNNQVDEGPGGDANNFFNFSYKVDRAVILINSATLGVGIQVDLEGNPVPQNDIQFTADGLETTAPCDAGRYCLGILSPALTFETAHYDAVSASFGVNQAIIPNSALTPGTIIGVLTSDGRRAVMRVDAVTPGVAITLTWRVYN